MILRYLISRKETILGIKSRGIGKFYLEDT